MSDGGVAYLDAQRQLVVLTPGGAKRSLTGLDDLQWAFWGKAQPQDIHSWPAWSPTGTCIGAFRISRVGLGARLVICEAHGHSACEGVPCASLPITLQWSPTGDALAVLTQDDAALVLERVPAANPEAAAVLMRGSPLFFSFVDNHAIAAFVGGANGASILVADASGCRTLPGLPSHFCAPVALGNEVLYVTQQNGSLAVVATTLQGVGPRVLESVHGLVSMVRHAGGEVVARAIARDPEGGDYEDLRLMNRDGVCSDTLIDGACTAFFWWGDALVVACRTDRTCLTFDRVDTTTKVRTRLCTIDPSRDLRFWLRFFEQYAGSHPLTTAEDLWLAGHLSAGAPGETRVPRIVRVPLAGGVVQEIGEGWFATVAGDGNGRLV